MVWNKQAECMSKEEKEKLQLERLQQTVKLAYNNVSFYKEKFDEAGITPEDIKTLKDIEKIPFTTKDDLRAAYPFGLFAVPYEEIVEIHASSGTSGKPTVTGYTKEDLDIWSECIARGLGMVGVEKEYISILGIFAAMVLAFVGGITFSTSVLQNISAVSVFRLLLVVDFLAFVLINVIYILVKFIFTINEKNAKLFNIMALNVACSVIAVIIVISWMLNADQIPDFISQFLPWTK